MTARLPTATSEYPDVAQSYELYERAGQLIPGWTQLISRRASQFANGVSPVYAAKAKGSRFTSVDGVEYIDWINAVTAVILGHADDVVDGAVKEQIDRGSIYTLNCSLEIELAELLNETIPSSEMARFTKGGGEACAVAARIARGTTGRDKMIICGYHGWHDWYQAANFSVDPTTGEYPFAGIEPIGVPRALESTIFSFAEGDLDELEALLEEHRGEVAGIMMEPARSELPPPGYLESVKQLAADHDVILIFDEVSCGWRISTGGVQKAAGVTPDMTVVAKAMSNGYAAGAVVGSREIMEPAGRMFVSSSYWSDNVGLVASLTTIRELERRNSEERFKEIGESVRSTMNEVISSVGLAGSCTGMHVAPTITLDLPDNVDPRTVQTLFIQEMARRGIHSHMGFKATLAHTEEDIRLTAEFAAEALGVIKSGLENENLTELLDVDLKKDPFRRQVT